MSDFQFTVDRISRINEHFKNITDDVILLMRMKQQITLKIDLLLRSIAEAPYNPDARLDQRWKIEKLLKQERRLMERIMVVMREREQKVRELRALYTTLPKRKQHISSEENYNLFKESSLRGPLTLTWDWRTLREGLVVDPDCFYVSIMFDLEPLKRGVVTGVTGIIGFPVRPAFVKVHWGLKRDKWEWEKLLGAFRENSKVSHPNILSIYGSQYETCSIAFELSPFEHTPTLYEALFGAQRIWLNFAEKMNICKQVFEGLVFLHGKKIVHGNIKLSNVVLVEGYNAKISDGCVPSAYESQLLDHWKRSHTLEFKAPEIFNQNMKINHPTEGSDMWSLGILMLVLITEQLPYSHCNTAQEMIKAIQSYNLPSFSHFATKNSRLHLLLTTALNPKPSERLPNNKNFFSKVLFDQNKMELSIWDYIIAKAAASTYEEALNLFKGLSPDLSPVLWSDLLKEFEKIVDKDGTSVYKAFKMRYENLDDCLKLCFAPNSSPREPGTKVLASDFRLVVRSFPTGSLSEFLILLVQVIDEPWYYGVISREDANKVLEEDFSKTRRPNYLVRLSPSADSIVISYIPFAGSCIEHVSLEHHQMKKEHFRCKGLVAYLALSEKELKLKPVLNSPSRPFNLKKRS